jgi:5-hmdU DNA kinase, helical domain
MNLEPFLYWAAERESIREKRVRGLPPPWTKDPVLATHRFCNLRREDDRETIWIRTRVREPYADDTALPIMLCICRLINWSPTLEELIKVGAWPGAPGFSLETLRETLDARKSRGEKCHTGAYIVPPIGYRSKNEAVTAIVGELWKRHELLKFEFNTTLEDSWKTLCSYRGFGAFLANQVVVDMSYCRRLLYHAPDRNRWLAAGPGTKRGLNRLFERPVRQPISQGQALFELRFLYSLMMRKGWNGLDLADIGSLLCEVDKYLRLVNGEGSVRAKFDAEKSYRRDNLPAE